MVEATLSFDDIFYTSEKGVSKYSSGKLKFASAGFGWKDSSSGNVHTERAEDLISIRWLRSMRGQGFQIRTLTSSGKICIFEGFSGEALPALTEFFKTHYNIPLKSDEASGKGWNWGKVEIKQGEEELEEGKGKVKENSNNNNNNNNNNNSSSLNYTVAGRLAFTVPLNQVTNALVASKNELALEFSNGLNQVVQDEKDDFVTELRFYIPNKDDGEDDEEAQEEKKEEKMKMKKVKTEDMMMDYEELDTTEIGGGSNAKKDDDEEEDGNNQPNVAEMLLEQIKNLSDFSKVSGEVIAALPEIACVVPRGRYSIDMYASFLRLNGKSYDYKIDYTAVQKLFLIPKTDDSHILLVLALDPPLKQGLTRYPHLIMQFPKDEKIDEFELKSLSASDLSGNYGGKLQAKYTDVSTFELVSVLFRGLAGQKIVVPGSFKSIISGHPAIKCTIKANEGALYPLEKNFLFIPKPILLIPHADVAQCIFSRVGGPTSSFGGNPRSFDLKISVRGTGAEHLFSNIAKEELDGFIEYLRSKQIPFTTEAEGRVRSGSGGKKSSGENDNEEAADDGEDDDSTDEDYGEDEDDESDDGSYDGSDESGSESGSDDGSYDEDDE